MRFEKEIEIFFRCDSGPDYGLGHLMRCISLAQGFKLAGIEKIVFLLRRINDVNIHLKVLKEEGFRYITLPDKAKGLQFEHERYLNSGNVTIMIFDNYDVTIEQMILYKKKYKNLVAIDDLADRNFSVDFIINQNINSEGLKYEILGTAKCLLGTSYVLLRKDILQLKNRKRERGNSKYSHIFMSFGGGNIYPRIKNLLMMFVKIDQLLDYRINIDFAIIGNSNHNVKISKCFSGFNNINVNMIVGKYDIASVMKRADFALTAAGSTVFELAFLGIPQIVFIIDKNQELTGQKVNEKGFGKCLGYIDDISEVEFTELFFEFLRNRPMKESISKKGQEFIDGKGVERAVDEIINYYKLPA